MRWRKTVENSPITTYEYCHMCYNLYMHKTRNRNSRGVPIHSHKQKMVTTTLTLTPTNLSQECATVPNPPNLHAQQTPKWGMGGGTHCHKSTQGDCQHSLKLGG